MTPRTALPPTVAGPLWMLGMVISFSLMAIAVRELTPRIHAFEMMLFRASVGLLILAPFMIRARKTLRMTKPPLHLLRGLIILTGQVAWFFGVIFLPLATVFAIEFTAPIWAGIMALIFLGERLTRGRVIAVLMGFAGVMIIVQPGTGAVHWTLLLMVLAAICFAGNFTITRYLTRTDSMTAMLFTLHLVPLPFAAALAAFHWTTPTIGELGWLVVIGSTGITAHFCLTRALTLADAAIVVPVDFLRLPLIAVVGAIFYDEPLVVEVFVGAALIFAGNYLNILFERRRVRRPAG